MCISGEWETYGSLRGGSGSRGDILGEGSFAQELVADMSRALLVIVEIALQEVWKKQQLHHHEEDEQFDQDDQPQGFPDGHPAETVVVEQPYAAGC